MQHFTDICLDIVYRNVEFFSHVCMSTAYHDVGYVAGDIALLSGYVINCCWLLKVLVVIDAKPNNLGLPTEAYYAVEEVHDVSINVM